MDTSTNELLRVVERGIDFVSTRTNATFSPDEWESLRLLFASCKAKRLPDDWVQRRLDEKGVE